MRTVMYPLRLVVRIMAWFSYIRPYSFFEWLWRKLCCLGCCIRRRIGFVPIPWPKSVESQGKPEKNVEDQQNCPEEKVEKKLEEVVEQSRCEGQNENAAAGKKAADSNRDLAYKRPRHDEDGDEFDSEDEEYRVETTDELYCGYDSTWEIETEEHQTNTFMRSRRPAASKHYKFSRFENAARDMQNYRHDYPTQNRPKPFMNPVYDDKPNLKFYLGLTPSIPDGVYIDQFHIEWYAKYDQLEFVHSYIQWLFPLQEPGMNYEASTLTKEEIKEFCQNSSAKANLLKSYELMLDFYGIRLCDENTGEVERASNWRDRFDNLNSHTHNNLRITRILKCQGTLGYPHYQAPLVRFFLKETLVHKELPNVKESVLNYFVFAVLDKKQRRRLLKFAYLNYDRKDEFVWCPKKIQMMWSEQSASKPQKRVKGKKEVCEYFSLDKEDEAKDQTN
ncbi:opioid growth factor receptor-like isoform X2 [Sander lucioperca]|uniref:opioid growth factor receptor-like isoform X2 n=1 Tax=Sander lucioperca TaxID=283035 RepID=UPI00125E0CA7|nr:opioid growth factor receptor-like isoform X2 [Sander lucioperca]